LRRSKRTREGDEDEFRSQGSELGAVQRSATVTIFLMKRARRTALAKEEYELRLEPSDINGRRAGGSRRGREERRKKGRGRFKNLLLLRFLPSFENLTVLEGVEADDSVSS